MNRNSVLNQNEYARREVSNEESLLLEQCFCDFGWECLKKESLSGGKTQLYFRRERQEGAKKANKLNALQKDCEKLIRDVEHKRKYPSVPIAFITLIGGIAAVYFFITGIIAAVLGSFAAAGGFASAGCLLLLIACACNVAAPRLNGKARMKISGITEDISQMRKKARQLRGE